MTVHRKPFLTGRGLLRVASRAGTLVVLIVLLTSTVASASSVNGSVVDVDAPTGQVSLAPGGSGNITIKLSVTGNQDGTATFKINRTWTLSGGAFSGSNPETFTVPPRKGGDPATTFTTSGTITVASGHTTGGPFTLAVPAFDITNSNTSGGKLESGSFSSYAVTVVAPSDSTPPVLTPTITGTKGSNEWYTSDVVVSWAVTDPETTAVISGCTTDTFTTDTTGVTSSCTAHSVGGSTTKAVTLKIDKTAPTNVVLAPSGTDGTNGWYTSEVNVVTSGTDSTSGVTCTPDKLLSTESASHSVSGSCTNGAGLTTSATPITVKIDLSDPSASLAVTSGTLGSNGWYTTNVTVTATGSDSLSGPVTCDRPVDLVDETKGTMVTGSCTNDAGRTTSAAGITVKIDKSNPTAALAPSGTVGENGWYTSKVVVTTRGSDSISDPTSCTDDQTIDQETSGTVVNGSCTNDAGLTETAPSKTVKIDTSAPTDVTLSVHSGTAGSNGWHTSDVVVRTNGQDPTSGVTCTADETLISETNGTLVTGSCRNGAGLITHAAPITIKIDKTAPSATLTASGTLGSNGWYISDVTVGTSGQDAMSGVTCTPDQPFVGDLPETLVNGRCTNGAGLSTAATPITIKIDKTAPTEVRFVGGISEGSSYYFGSVPTAPTCSATGGTSGFDVCTVTGHSTAVGAHTLTATARDNAGNVSTATLSYTVLPWRISGFYSPVNMDTATERLVNTVKGGSTVPLKFEVFAGSNEITDTSSIVALKTNKLNCTTGASVEDPVEALATGGTALRYDATAGQFIYNWKTPTGTNTCYDVVVGTTDGSAILAHFKLK